MAKEKTIFTCSECGNQSSKWMGKCSSCGSWNSYQEATLSSRSHQNLKQKSYKKASLNLDSTQGAIRLKSGLSEFDRVTGGGIVKDSVLLLSGEPGIGKSTFLLQLAGRLSQQTDILLISGEESENQIQQRAARLRLSNTKNIQLMSEIELPVIESAIRQEKPGLVIIDSVQTIFDPEIQGSAGNVSQVRECSSRLFRMAKEIGFILIFVGHITKDGVIAGPRLLEHMVDVVLYFEGNHKDELRILRSKKNRYGNTFEIAIYKMGPQGLEEITSVSNLFLEKHHSQYSGVAITAAYDSRVILLEVQALVTQTSFGMPQRTAIGYDPKKLALLLAILEKRAGLFLKSHDVFVKITGGFKSDDPALDMAVAMSIWSSYSDTTIPSHSIFTGELGLGGEFKKLTFLQNRINEALKMNFRHIYIPYFQSIQILEEQQKWVHPVKSIPQLIDMIKN